MTEDFSRDTAQEIIDPTPNIEFGEVTSQEDTGPVHEIEQEHDKKKSHASLGGIAALLVVLFKFKGIIFLVLAKLKFLIIPLKYLKFGKVFTTLGSMIFSIVIDAMVWGWAFAVGFVILLFVHEMGHVLAIRSKGIKAGPPVFIPFVGAIIAMKEMPKDAKTEAEIGIAGPLLGTIGAFLCLQLGGPGGRELFTRLAYIGFMLNLFNLLPVLPLDGGRVMAAISPKVWLVGLILAVMAFLVTHNPILLVLVILSASRMWHDLKDTQENLDYYAVPRKTRVQLTFLYFGLAAFLAFQMMELHHKPQPQPYRPIQVSRTNSDFGKTSAADFRGLYAD